MGGLFAVILLFSKRKNKYSSWDKNIIYTSPLTINKGAHVHVCALQMLLEAMQLLTPQEKKGLYIIVLLVRRVVKV